MKILISAYACEPGQGSEEGVGWNMVTAIAQHHEVWVLTRTFYRKSIEAELSLNSRKGLHFTYLEPFGWSQNWKGKQGGVQLHYYLWQIQAYLKAKALHEEHLFDVAHHVTYVKFWSPSFISLLPIPFVWGPVGGGETAPKTFWKDFSLRAKLYEVLRDVAQRVGETDPFTRLTARRSAISYATTADTADRVRSLGDCNVQILPESGLSQKEISMLEEYEITRKVSIDEPIRFISFGRLLHWKGYHLSLQAFLMADLENAEYWLVGDGPEQQRLQNLIDEAGKASKVKLWGRLPRDATMQKLRQSHIVVHPSLHDSGGWTCLEAMAAGRPVICFQLGGPDVQITDRTGIKIPAVNPEQAVSSMAKAMQSLANDKELRIKMGKAGRERVKSNFSWDIKSQFFAERYQEVVESFAKKNTFSKT